ncbi:MAG: aspartate/glutamate racemase family protein [Acetobacteraceae bacterium]
MSNPIYVINPNSNTSVTAAIDAAVAPLRSADGPPIACLTLADGPAAVESQRSADAVVSPLLREAALLEKNAAGFVIACFSDPGLFSLREQSRHPVLGIAECGVATALTLGRLFGVIAILQVSVARHLRYFGAMGVLGRLAADLPVGLGVAELANEERTMDRMITVGRTLRDLHGADVLIMGCAGMARYRAALERTLDIPVVEPTQAAVAMAVGRIRLGWRQRLPEESAARAGASAPERRRA